MFFQSLFFLSISKRIFCTPYSLPHRISLPFFQPMAFLLYYEKPKVTRTSASHITPHLPAPAAFTCYQVLTIMFLI